MLNRVVDPTTNRPDLIEAPDTITFPAIHAGVAGEFAKTYADISEAPEHFYLMAYLVCIGSALAADIKIRTILKVQPRLYLIFLGVSGRGRKSTPINLTTGFFKEIVPTFALMHHANSGEGLGVYLEKHNETLLTYDEFMGFVAKASQKGNTILGTVTSLFEKNEYQTATKDKQLLIENANLSLLAACTTDTWERCWSVDFTAIGLVNRLFLVPGNMDKLVPIPPELGAFQWKDLKDKTLSAIQLARRIKTYELTTAGKELYDDWYYHGLDHHSLHSVRLETYALRLMLILAVCVEAVSIDEKIVADAIALVDWQFQIRQLYDPLDADNETAKTEVRIRRALSTGPKTKRELQQITNAQRTGLWIWKNALTNLTENQEIFYSSATKQYTTNNIL